MRLLKGEIPTSQAWRVIVLLTPGEGVQLAWELGLTLARANQGVLLAVALIEQPPEAPVDDRTREQLQTTLSQLCALAQPDDTIEQVIVQSDNVERTLRTIVTEANGDLLITDCDTPLWRSLGNVPCTVAALRYSVDVAERVRDHGIQRILLPTSGGPHTRNAVEFLTQLDPAIEIDALYVSRTTHGAHEEALGQAQLETLLQYANATERIQARVIRADDPTQGIVATVDEGYDLVVIGASQQTTIERALFSELVSTVVRDSKTPVLVVRRATSPLGALFGRLAYRVQQVIPRLSQEERRDVYVRVRNGANPDIDFNVLMILSAAIAALGLILNSPAVVIGAMLVAPLMGPIVGGGMALVLGDVRFMRFAFGAALRGALLAIGVGLVLGLLPGSNMTAEVLARTQPNLIDLGVALFSGLAGAFALAYAPAAGALPGVAIAAALVPPLASVGLSFAEGDWPRGFGALLLFTTNLVAIASASAFVFVVFGFRPSPAAKIQRIASRRSSQLAVVSLVLVSAILAFATIELARGVRRTSTIEQVARAQVTAIMGNDATIVDFNPDRDIVLPAGRVGEPLVLSLTVQSTSVPLRSTIVDLQAAIALALQEQIDLRNDFQLNLTHIQVNRLEQFVLPTATPEAGAPGGAVPAATPVAQSGGS